MTVIKSSRIFIRTLSILVCLQLWASGRMGSTQVGAVEGTWTQNYQAPYSNLVRGGQEGTDRWPTYVCQASISQGTYPGKFVPDRSSCYISVGRSEVRATTFKVLRESQGRRYVWSRGGGRIDQSAVVGGRTKSGRKLYICRTNPVPVSKGFWSGRATLVGNIAEGSGECIAPWLESSKGYSQYDILTDSTARGRCVPREEFEVITSVRNAGDSDQTITKSFQMGTERREGSSQTNSRSQTRTMSSGFSLGIDIKGIKAGFETMVGKSSTTGFDWTKTSSSVWNSATTQTLPINVKARTRGTLKQLVGVCGDVRVRTGFIDIDSTPL